MAYWLLIHYLFGLVNLLEALWQELWEIYYNNHLQSHQISS